MNRFRFRNAPLRRPGGAASAARRGGPRVEPPGGTGHLEGPRGRQHRRLFLRRSGRPLARGPDRQLDPARRAGRRPQLLPLRRGHPVRVQHRLGRRRPRGRRLPASVHAPRPEPEHLPAEHRSRGQLADGPEPERLLHVHAPEVRGAVAQPDPLRHARLRPRRSAELSRPEVLPQRLPLRPVSRGRRHARLRRTALRPVLRGPRHDLRPRQLPSRDAPRQPRRRHEQHRGLQRARDRPLDSDRPADQERIDSDRPDRPERRRSACGPRRGAARRRPFSRTAPIRSGRERGSRSRGSGIRSSTR